MPRRNYFAGTTETQGVLELAPVSAPPSDRNIGDLYLDDGTNTTTGNPGWRYLVSQFPDVWADTSSGVVDTSAVHKATADEFDTVALKATPATADRILIEDSDDSLAKKYITVAGLPTGANIYAPAVIVGNSVAGDDSGNCHYLDIGDGSQLAVAIEAAAAGGNPLTDPPKDVFIRPGTYDFRNSGAPNNAIAIPDNIKVRGAGIGNTIIIGESIGDMGVFTLGDNSSLEDVLIQVPLATGTGTTSRGVVTLNGVGGYCERVEVEFLGTWGATEAGYVYLRSAFLGETTAGGCRIIDCKATVPRLYEWLITTRGIYILGPAVSNTWNIERNLIVGSDIGIEFQVTANVVRNRVENFSTGGIHIDGDTQFVTNSSISENYLDIYTIPLLRPVTGNYGIKCSGMLRGSISGNLLYAETPATSGVQGVSMTKVEKTVVSGNRGIGWGTSIYLSANANDNIVTSNCFESSGSIENTFNAAGNEIAHNS